MPLLTKSKYIIGLQCPKYLWMMFHDLDKIPELDAATEYHIKQGHIVGQLAKKLFPDGIDLPEKSEDFKLNLRKTQELLKERKTLFEAGIISGDLYARADILVPVGKNEWDIVEVKSSARVKEDHMHDLSFQKYVYEKAGLQIRKCFLMHINNEYVKKGEIDPKDILVKEEVDVDEVIIGIQDRIDEMMKIIGSKKAPDVSIGMGCNLGLKCVSEECWSFLPEGHVFELYYGGKKSLELLEAEVLAIKDIPDEFKLSSKQQIQRECARTGEVYLNKEGLGKFISRLKYPLYYLDFETFSTAVPIYDGVKPYQQIPFQFSLHVEDDGVRHFEYLHDSKEDPREKFLLELKKVLGSEGSVIVFYKSFEISRLRELALAFPEHKEWVESVVKRVVDLSDPFSNFDYYNPKQKGSSSIKEILPAVTGKDYKGLDINNGGLAAVSYFESVFGDVLDKAKIRKDLLEYCSLDTEGMVWIVEKLRKV